jgi:hypothetical protein
MGLRSSGPLRLMEAKFPPQRTWSVDVTVYEPNRAVSTWLQSMAGTDAFFLRSLKIASILSPLLYKILAPLYEPVLQHLKIHSIFIPAIAPSLTLLSLDVTFGETYYPVHLIFDVLSQLPLLRHLFLGTIAECNPKEYPTADTSISLKHLQSFALRLLSSSSGSLITTLFVKSSVPALASISIQCGPTLSVPFPVLSAIAHTIWKDDPPTGLEISNTGDMNIVLRFYSSFPAITGHSSMPFPDTSNLRASFTMWRSHSSIGQPDLTESITSLADQVDLGSISALSVCGSIGLHEDWLGILSAFPGVQTLHFLDNSGTPDTAFFTALGTHVGIDPPKVLLPHLKFLWLATDARDVAHAAYKVPLGAIMTALTSRAKLGTSKTHSPQSLRLEADIALKNPDGDEPALLELRVLVQNIRWKR